MLRLSEHYVSIQGEGPRVGELTQFVRFAGCNMRCPGWPCDTQHAIDPKIWKVESEKMNAPSLLFRIEQMRRDTGANNICLTGGEPLLHEREGLGDIARNWMGVDQGTVDLFTNGSIPLPDWTRRVQCRVMMDWKLAGSGEAQTHRKERLSNLAMLRPKDAIKFVAVDQADLEEARALTKGFQMYSGFTIWVAPAWERISVDEIMKFIQEEKLTWRVNVQVHKYLWPNVERGI